jgi:hypothetical protein
MHAVGVSERNKEKTPLPFSGNEVTTHKEVIDYLWIS